MTSSVNYLVSLHFIVYKTPKARDRKFRRLTKGMHRKACLSLRPSPSLAGSLHQSPSWSLASSLSTFPSHNFECFNYSKHVEHKLCAWHRTGDLVVNENRVSLYPYEAYSSGRRGRHGSTNHIHKCKIVMTTSGVKDMTLGVREHIMKSLTRPMRSDEALMKSVVRDEIWK